MMNSIQIESWALRIIDCVKKSQPNEDFLVELKREWIDPEKAARRIAGHANSARGENVLWLIGVDEVEGVIGASDNDLASWYPAVESCFNEIAPSMISLNIPIDGTTVVALLFETDRAPYIIKNSAYGKTGGGSTEFEVPWREGTRLRTARRSDLIRLIAPLELLPDVEIIDVSLAATIGGQSSSTGNHYPDEMSLTAELYIVPKNRQRVVIPFHRCQVEFEISGIPVLKAHWIRLNPAESEFRGMRPSLPGSLTIQSTAHEIIIDDPGKISLKALSARPSSTEDLTNRDIRISIHLLPTGADRPLVLVKTLTYPEAKSPQ
jgi:hypothetical protein